MIRICMAGIGGMGTTHFGRYMKLIQDDWDVEIAGIFDLRRDKYEEIMAQYPQCAARYYSNYDEMLSVEKPDAVDIALPDFLHAKFAIIAMKAGANVLCEKPMAMNGDETDEMIRVSHETGRELMIAHCLRYVKQYRVLYDIVKSGRLGRINSAEFYRVSRAPSGVGGWFMQKNRSGGCVLDMHVHDIDIVQWLFGKPEAVSALGKNIIEGSGIDTINAQYRYSDFYVNLHSTWALKGEGLRFRDGYEVDFENGTVQYTRSQGTTIYEIGKEPVLYPMDDTDECDGYLGEIKAFISTLEGREGSKAQDTKQASDSIKLALLECESVEKHGAWMTL